MKKLVIMCATDVYVCMEVYVKFCELFKHFVTHPTEKRNSWQKQIRKFLQTKQQHT